MTFYSNIVVHDEAKGVGGKKPWTSEGLWRAQPIPLPLPVQSKATSPSSSNAAKSHGGVASAGGGRGTAAGAAAAQSPAKRRGGWSRGLARRNTVRESFSDFVEHRDDRI